MMRPTAAVLGLVAVLGGPARADDASRLKLATAIVETSHAGDNLRSLLPTFMTQMRDLISRQQPGDPKDVEVYVKRFEQRLGDGIPRFVELVAQIYAREFSEADLGNLLAFYRTPAGQHLIAKQAVIARSMVVVGQEWGKSIGAEVLAEMAKEKAATPSPKL